MRRVPVPSRATALTLIAGGLGGAMFHLLNFPAAWLSGSMIVITVLAFARVPLEVPDPVRNVAFVLLGLSLGSGFTPEALAGAAQWPLSIAALFVSLPIIIAAGLSYLVRVGRWDRSTAFFSVVPGALSAVMAFALESKADPRLVALAQSLRIFILVALLPLFVVAGTTPTGVAAAAAEPPMLEGVAALTALAASGLLAGILLWRAKGTAMMFSAMAASAALHAFNIVGGGLPAVLLAPGLVLLGCIIGKRFEGAGLGLMKQALGPSVGAFIVTLIVAGGFAFGVAWALVLPPSQVFLAFAPGGLEAMMLLAFILGLDPAYVGVHHLARFLGLMLALPFISKPFLEK